MTQAEPQRHAQPTGRPGAGAVLAEQMDEAGGKRAKSRNIRPLGRLLPFLGRHKMDAAVALAMAVWGLEHPPEERARPRKPNLYTFEEAAEGSRA